jgi:DNA-binding transcriptional MerR regulator
MTSAATLGNVSDTLSIPGPVHGELNDESARESTIGEMAAEYGVSLRTLRFYEDRRLLRPRREGTMRLYSGVDRLRLQMIIKGKQLGFTLTEIADLIGTQDSSVDFEEKLQPAQITTQIDHLERQRREIDDAIARLRATHARLAHPSNGHEQLQAASR